MTGFILEDVVELALFGFLPLLVTVATVWIIWHVLNPDDATDIPSFLTFIIVVIPFVMIIYGGLSIIIYDHMMNLTGGPRSVYLPLATSSWVILAGAASYVGLTALAWLHWRRLQTRQ